MSETIYDYPLYYDILYGWDRSAEAFFLDGIFQKYDILQDKSVLEIGCGTGLVSIRLARLGWEAVGIDLSAKMIGFFEKKIFQEELSTKVSAIQADMTNFSLKKPCGAAYCPVGTFGLLPEDDLVVQHLQSVAKNLTNDGIYVIDLGIAEGETKHLDYSETELVMSHKNIEVRAENGEVFVHDSKKKIKKTLSWGTPPKEYNYEHFRNLVKDSKAFQILAWYPEVEQTPDGLSIFDYTAEISKPEEIDRAVVVMRKK